MILDFLKEIPDRRDREGRMYDLAHILLFTILAILSNAKITKMFGDLFQLILKSSKKFLP